MKKAKARTKALKFPEKLYVTIEGEDEEQYLQAVDGGSELASIDWVNGQQVAIYKRIDVRTVKKATEFE